MLVKLQQNKHPGLYLYYTLKTWKKNPLRSGQWTKEKNTFNLVIGEIL